MQGFGERIRETLGEDSICKDLLDFGRGFARICETLGEDSQGFVRLWERKQGFARLWDKDLQGFMRLWERICKDSARLWERICKDSDSKDLQDFGRGFTRIC